jgi:hypothetical protein
LGLLLILKREGLKIFKYGAILLSIFYVLKLLVSFLHRIADNELRICIGIFYFRFNSDCNHYLEGVGGGILFLKKRYFLGLIFFLFLVFQFAVHVMNESTFEAFVLFLALSTWVVLPILSLLVLFFVLKYYFKQKKSRP